MLSRNNQHSGIEQTNFYQILFRLLFFFHFCCSSSEVLLWYTTPACYTTVGQHHIEIELGRYFTVTVDVCRRAIQLKRDHK